LSPAQRAKGGMGAAIAERLAEDGMNMVTLDRESGTR
jgi:NAD(P)-dependent dehydrogenase (short-subunit alcohol dehydrogenase family)